MTDDEVEAELDRLVGRVVRQSANLEAEVRLVAYAVVPPLDVAEWQGTPEERDIERLDGARVPGSLRTGRVQPVRSFRPLLELVAPYVRPDRIRDAETRRRLEVLLDRADRVYRRRNRVVHDPPLPIDPAERGERGPAWRRHRLDEPAAPVDVDLRDLEALVADLVVVTACAQSFRATLYPDRIRAAGWEPPDLSEVTAFYAPAWARLESRPAEEWGDLG